MRVRQPSAVSSSDLQLYKHRGQKVLHLAESEVPRVTRPLRQQQQGAFGLPTHMPSQVILPLAAIGIGLLTSSASAAPRCRRQPTCAASTASVLGSAMCAPCTGSPTCCTQSAWGETVDMDLSIAAVEAGTRHPPLHAATAAGGRGRASAAAAPAGADDTRAAKPSDGAQMEAEDARPPESDMHDGG